MQNLKKKYGGWALITGASSGIGKEFARELAAQGMDLILVARRKDELNKIANELMLIHKVNTQVIAIDLTKKDAVQTLYRHHIEALALDIGLVIPAAGVDEMGMFLEKDYAALEKMVRLNIDVPTQLIHLTGQKMAKRNRSGIILVSSLFGYQGIPHFATYAATKAYILTLGEALTAELKKTGIDVITLSPGLTNTPFADGLAMNKSLLPMFPQNPRTVARTGLRHLGRKMTVVSGLLNKFYAWENRFLPRAFPVYLFGTLIGNAVRSYKKRQHLKNVNTST
jgi:short-subunit dehydrogenase